MCVALMPVYDQPAVRDPRHVPEALLVLVCSCRQDGCLADLASNQHLRHEHGLDWVQLNVYVQRCRLAGPHRHPSLR